MFKGTIKIKRLRTAGEKNINNNKVPAELEECISKYIKTNPSMYFLKHMEDVLPHFAEKGQKTFRVDPNKTIGTVIGFDNEYVYFKPKDRNVKYLITDEHRVLFIYNANNDNDKVIVDEVVLIYIQEETEDEIERIMKINDNKNKPKQQIIKEALENYNKEKNIKPWEDQTNKVLTYNGEPPKIETKKEVKFEGSEDHISIEEVDKDVKKNEEKRTTKSSFIKTEGE